MPIPRALVDGGHVARLSPSALKLYLVLVRLAQKHTAVQIETPAYEVRDYTGLDHKSVTKAGRELREAGLVLLGKGTASVMSYQLFDPESGNPLPIPEGRRGVRRYEPKPGRSARTTRLSKSLTSTHAPARETLQQSQDRPKPLNAGADTLPPTWAEISSQTARELLPTTPENFPPENGNFSRAGLANAKENRDFRPKPLSENISEKRISEQRGEFPEQQVSMRNPKAYECSVHGNAADFAGPFCLMCHPECSGEGARFQSQH